MAILLCAKAVAPSAAANTDTLKKARDAVNHPEGKKGDDANRTAALFFDQSV